MNKDLELNFLPIKSKEFEFPVFVKEANLHSNQPCNYRDAKYYKLFGKGYCVEFNFQNGFKKIIVKSSENVYLTNWYLSYLLERNLRREGLNIKKTNQKFNSLRIYIVIETVKGIGDKTVWFEPYYLKSKELFGFLIDFKFLLDNNYKFDKEVQRLSFSLDNDFRSNINYHIDKYRYVYDFIKQNYSTFKQLGNSIEVSDKFFKLSYSLLKSKEYIFKDNNNDHSQFNGLKKFGPYSMIDSQNILYVYLYNSQSVGYANDLVKSLNGKTFAETFNGLNEFFNLPRQNKQNVRGIKIVSYNIDQKWFDDNLKSKFQDNDKIVIAIIPAKEEKLYYLLKNYCLNNNIPLQVVNNETIKNRKVLKWAVSGIGLQIFTKLGGTPWIVKTDNSGCLIVGIGQSLKRNKDGKIIKFRAFSVLFESSGKFQMIKPLADTSQKEQYLKEIAKNVSNLLEKFGKHYKKIVFHVPEKIKKKDIEVIENILKKNTNNVELYILRINDNPKFFGYNTNNNSLVPYEGSYVKLSDNEYLVWTEGLCYYKTNVAQKRYANPLYVNFYYYNNGKIKDEKLLLQDILNLSGANYRSFNAKSLPVSIFYPKLIANFYKNFEQFSLGDCNLGDVKRPWFL